VLFPTHLVAACLIGRRRGPSTPWLVAGAALPDLIDKPLAMAGLLDRYHSVGHSLLALVGLGVGVVAVRGPEWIGLRVGWASHLGLDAARIVVNGRPEDVRFLRWPVVRHVPAVQLPPVEFAVHYVGTPGFVVEIGIWLAVVGLVGRDHHDRAGRARSRPG